MECMCFMCDASVMQVWCVWCEGTLWTQEGYSINPGGVQHRVHVLVQCRIDQRERSKKRKWNEKCTFTLAGNITQLINSELKFRAFWPVTFTEVWPSLSLLYERCYLTSLLQCAFGGKRDEFKALSSCQTAQQYRVQSNSKLKFHAFWPLWPSGKPGTCLSIKMWMLLLTSRLDSAFRGEWDEFKVLSSWQTAHQYRDLAKS